MRKKKNSAINAKTILILLILAGVFYFANMTIEPSIQTIETNLPK